jgi:hypothetical protein
VTSTFAVELVRLYSNLSAAPLGGARSACSATRPAEASKRPRQHHRRLGPAEVAKLIETYGQGVTIKQLAERFGIHRVTVSALLHRHGVSLRLAGLGDAEVEEAASLYRQGWTLAGLGKMFAVNPVTVWRRLQAVGVNMWPPRAGMPLP